MNAHNFNWLKTGADSKALAAKELHQITGVPPFGQVDDEERLAKLPIWQRTSTTLAAKYVSPTGAAILAHAETDDKELPRVEGWKDILKEIEFNKHGFVRSFLKSVVYWSHRSTNGRFNPTLGRFERWGVMSAEEWWGRHHYEAPNPNYQPHHPGDYPPWMHAWKKTIPRYAVSRPSFFRIKRDLIRMGLIQAESHLWRGKNYLWIKPTEELSRIIFEPGYWETVRAKYAFAPTKKKPRGLSAKPQSNNQTL